MSNIATQVEWGILNGGEKMKLPQRTIIAFLRKGDTTWISGYGKNASLALFASSNCWGPIVVTPVDALLIVEERESRVKFLTDCVEVTTTHGDVVHMRLKAFDKLVGR